MPARHRSLALLLIGLAMTSCTADDPAPAAPSPTVTATTTTTITTTTTTTTTAAEATVTWDGSACTYDGPESVPAGTAVTVTYRNDGDVPSDLQIDFLGVSTTIEDIAGVLLDEYRQDDPFPDGSVFFAGFPPYPASVDPGASFTGSFEATIARMHVFYCWSGGSASVVQGVDLAPAGLLVTSD